MLVTIAASVSHSFLYFFHSPSPSSPRTLISSLLQNSLSLRSSFSPFSSSGRPIQDLHNRSMASPSATAKTMKASSQKLENLTNLSTRSRHSSLIAMVEIFASSFAAAAYLKSIDFPKHKKVGRAGLLKGQCSTQVVQRGALECTRPRLEGEKRGQVEAAKTELSSIFFATISIMEELQTRLGAPLPLGKEKFLQMVA